MARKEKEQTRGQFKLIGKVKGISNENSLREGVTRNDDSYKSLSFFVETSPTNAIRVEMFGMERNEVYFYSSKHKKSKKVAWKNRNDSFPEYKLIGVRMGLEKDEKGANKQVMLVEYDAIDYIHTHLKDGDSVFVSGSIDFQSYVDRSGNEKESKRYTINSISLTKEPVDFHKEGFKEVASFEQEIVVTNTIIEGSKLYIGAKVINYKGEDTDTTFVVDTVAEGGKFAKLANNIKKRMKFGDFIKVFGVCKNEVILEEAEAEDDEDDWGGEKPAGMEYIRNYIQELRITAVDSSTYEPKKYTEDDFYNEGEENFGDDFEESPFEGDDFMDDFEDEDDDDLPF